ncbi:D-alanyl-D-alanine carboxypeptidase/D-alanyl-D-alanine-endopeptidase [Virgibacillus profundi]|uniref:D-alanyl-D-alanine carboxypeptidase/D-alanyl-D-alanine-endopeptidase n=1 Tax=Virgibacillus profundi TaxID=2024555 RepID=A0A2A2II41_9BACI|nr:D-alanyl-D-alanine carboxypeptidase/D-alanyl-D-alanine-endopeptidase [Virgibacillus profundi]PAV30775.1 D-alanyl-D-alanine carboxypeptidase/D-alanyl-D-alanine-endopeptidase [Virgibacillus profundi]PXY54958.1 D-alanyl-D-alanine carboxypeptidase/D-alanyl-D-alanine-endopeptidase [Virgibacillus profundi]
MKWKSYLKQGLLLIVIAVLAAIPIMGQNESLFVKASEEVAETEFEENAALEEKLAAILDNEHLEGTVTGVSVKNKDTGELLFSQDGDIRLHPASNMKLLTATAALETLGTDYRFSTEVLTDGTLRGKVLHGDLYLKGKGDPTLLKKDLDQFAKHLKAQGINKIKGDLVGDDTWYDDVRLSQDLNWSDEPFYTGAQISALNLSPNEDYDAGTVIVQVTPAEEADGEAEVTLTPETDYVTIENKTEMVASGESKSISIEREHGSNKIVVEGTMPVDGSNSRSWVSVWEPTGYAVDVFRKSLNEHGINFIGNSKVKFSETPDDTRILTSKESMPLQELLIPFMKLSNNGHGEVLTKEMGKVVHNEGSWDKGLEVMEEAITELGVNPDTILLRDGSGMSHKNMIPANDLAQLLYEAQEKSWFPAFEHSLPVAGESERLVGGTLRYRMTSGPAKSNVTAKTGSLTGVSALSGYVKTADGEDLIFSVMINNFLGSRSNMQAIEDAIATALAGHEF